MQAAGVPPPLHALALAEGRKRQFEEDKKAKRNLTGLQGASPIPGQATRDGKEKRVTAEDGEGDEGGDESG